MEKIVRNNSGLIYLGTVIMVIVLFGVLTYTVTNLLVDGDGKNANLYIDTQAELAAISGIEYAYYKLLLPPPSGFGNWTGTPDWVTMGKSKFTVTVDTLDDAGHKLDAGKRRVISIGKFENSVKEVQVKFSALSEQFSFALYIADLNNPAKSNNLQFFMSNTLKGNLYVGNNVDCNIKRADIDTCTIYVPPGHYVTSNPATFDDTYKWEIYPPPLPTFPVFDTTIHDSLLAIATAITSTSGNKIKGNYLISGPFSLAGYEDSTLFIKGNLTIAGSPAVVASATVPHPAYFIVDGTVDIKNGATVGDNIVTIASGPLSVVSTGTRYGLDWSALPVTQRPTRANELFSKSTLSISAGIVFANVEAMGDLSLRGTIYAACFCDATVEIESATFQGSVVARSTKLDRITNSVMEFILPLAITATGGLKPSPISGSFKWF